MGLRLYSLGVGRRRNESSETKERLVFDGHEWPGRSDARVLLRVSPVSSRGEEIARVLPRHSPSAEAEWNRQRWRSPSLSSSSVCCRRVSIGARCVTCVRNAIEPSDRETLETLASSSRRWISWIWRSRCSSSAVAVKWRFARAIFFFLYLFRRLYVRRAVLESRERENDASEGSSVKRKSHMCTCEIEHASCTCEDAVSISDVTQQMERRIYSGKKDLQSTEIYVDIIRLEGPR